MKLRSVILVLLALGLALSLPAPTDYKEEGELLVSCGLGHLVNRFREEEIDRNIMPRLGRGGAINWLRMNHVEYDSTHPHMGVPGPNIETFY